MDLAEIYAHRLRGIGTMHIDLALHIKTHQQITILYKALNKQLDNINLLLRYPSIYTMRP